VTLIETPGLYLITGNTGGIGNKDSYNVSREISEI